MLLDGSRGTNFTVVGKLALLDNKEIILNVWRENDGDDEEEDGEGRMEKKRKKKILKNKTEGQKKRKKN